ncbi:histidine kinase [candidate division KSB1 bacterium]|nr:histidine kinase [candidate division KSB1 bacterium]
MYRLFNQHPLLMFSIIGALVGSVTAMFFNPAMRWALLTTSSLTGLIIGVIFQQTHQRSVTRQYSTNQVVSTIKPELKPLPEPVTSLFLYNTLHNIAALILFDTIRASEVVDNLANFVRTITELKKTEQTYLGEEFKAIELYLNIERSRLGERLVVSKQFSQECFEIPFPSLALFPFIDGCIRFGAELQMNPVTVLISCYKDNETVVLEVADHIDESDGETWEAASRDAIFEKTKKRLLNFYGSSVKVSRRQLEPLGEHITIQIPLNNAMIGRSSRHEALPHQSV